jgi:RecB family endonuclease NucS
MSQAIFISKGGEGFVKCKPFEVESEERLRQLLEKLIEENVDIILPTPKGREPFKLAFLTREFGVPSGSIDLLGVDDEGYIYIIETKLHRSSERRRALAQALDYASALWSKYSRDHHVL